MRFIYSSEKNEPHIYIATEPYVIISNKEIVFSVVLVCWLFV